MDLKIKDVAELLNVSEPTIRRWLSKGLIPAYRLNHQFRFSRIEIENWVMSRKMEDNGQFSSEKNQSVPWSGTQQFSLYRAIHRGEVLVDLPSTDKEDIIRVAMNKMAPVNGWDGEVMADLLIDRERMMPTALTNGIGVPHARELVVPETFDVISVVFPKEPIEYGALDHKKVHTLFFLFACQDKSHLHLLAKLAHLANSQEVLDFLMTKPEKTELLSFIKNWESKLNQDTEVLQPIG